VLGSERREQGRRANEFSRTVTFERPVYIATREVTNAQFRAFGRPTRRVSSTDAVSISTRCP
jgi:formylglycine-generating enzyme required for sulfatase activity